DDRSDLPGGSIRGARGGRRLRLSIWLPSQRLTRLAFLLRVPVASQSLPELGRGAWHTSRQRPDARRCCSRRRLLAAVASAQRPQSWLASAAFGFDRRGP